jgi:4-hydroxybenzoate polyprenyltransferase
VDRGLILILTFLVSFAGVAGFGHVMNDLFDLEVDRAAAKPNAMQNKTVSQTLWILLALLATAWLPWLILPASKWNLALVTLQLLLLTAYAAPPLRLKTRPVPGIIADALYAYTVPALITWTTFQPLGVEPRPRQILLVVLVLWSFSAGLRGILNHQCLDADSDASSGLRTFATRYGRDRTLGLLVRIVLPAEVMCFVAVVLAFATEVPVLIAGGIIFIGWTLFQLAYIRGESLGLPWNLSSQRVVELYGYELLGEFYANWYPLFMLAALSLRAPAYLILAAAHLAFFQNGLVNFFRYDLRAIPGGLAKMTRHLG